MNKTSAQKQREYRQRIKDSGMVSKQLKLTQTAADHLDEIKKSGVNLSELILSIDIPSSPAIKGIREQVIDILNEFNLLQNATKRVTKKSNVSSNANNSVGNVKKLDGNVKCRQTIKLATKQ